MVPVEILEDIFAYLSRDALDHCEIICLKWSRLIETSKRLAQRRSVSFNSYYYRNDPIGRFFWELQSSTGKTFRFYDNQQELSAFPVFKNVIIQKLEEYCLYSSKTLDLLEKRLMKMFKLAGRRIIVKIVYLNLTTLIRKIGHGIMLKRLHDLLTTYIDADAIRMRFHNPGQLDNEDEVPFNKELWKYLDFGKKTEFNFHYRSAILPNAFSSDTFKEFISGKHMEHPTLNELQICFYRNDSHIIFRLIVEAFCNTDEPHKFFKCIKKFRIRYLDEIFGEFGFVREDRNPQKYRLSHPKQKWALEAILDEYELYSTNLVKIQDY